MSLDLNKISLSRKKIKAIDPRTIFLTLPEKSEKYGGYLRDVQSEVLDLWFSQRENKDNIIKMNTGSGKTVVGLLILKSCLNEEKGNAIYVVPDNYLVEQVVNEANNLGISVTKSDKDIDFISCKSILVINIQKLINGKSVFGMRNSGNIEIDNIIIDDAHACIDTAEKQFIINIKRNNNLELYNQVLKLFESSLKYQNERNLIDICNENYSSAPMLVPFWEVQDKKSALLKLISKYKDEDSFVYTYPLISDIFELCNCVISSRNIEISPKCLPINKISSFENAKKRIFMSATLQDDSVLVSHFNIDYTKVANIITPKNATDIGDRMILFPQALNSTISDEEIKNELKKLSINYRIVVIVPSTERINFWKDSSDRIFNKDNISDINKYYNGLDILLNRYDGVDLPNDNCRILVIDGLPTSNNNYDFIKEIMMQNSDEIIKDKIQKIEQGMGRGVRSNQDYCAVVIMGSTLVNILYKKNSRNFFSEATLKQFELSEELTEQLRNNSVSEIFASFNYCLKRDPQWVQLSKDILSNLSYSNKCNFNEYDVVLRECFDSALNKNYQAKLKKLEKLVNNIQKESSKGWFKLILAEYTNLFDKEVSQLILKSAKEINRNILFPISGILYKKKSNNFIQSNQLIDYCKQNEYNRNIYLIEINSILDRLIFIPDTYNQFEDAFEKLGLHLGFVANRPEKEVNDGGPDVLWNVGNNSYFIIECKNGTTSSLISKDYCGQLHNSKTWFERNYGKELKSYPIMVHLVNKFENNASPEDDFRIIDKEKLELIKQNVLSFAKEICTDTNFLNCEIISNKLNQYNLSNDKFISNYTKEAIISKK
nr:DEAD/DEAH box helicase family protein [Sedimentibacter sp.]